MSLIIILFLWWMSLNLGNLDTVVSFDVYGLYIFWIKNTAAYNLVLAF